MFYWLCYWGRVCIFKFSVVFMKDIFKNGKEFKELIGAFIIAFSKLEFRLVFLCAMTEFDLRLNDTYINKFFGYSFDLKVKQLTEFIDEHLVEIKPVWDKLKTEIGQLNRERRFLAHGFMNYYLPTENVTTYIKEKGGITPIALTSGQLLLKIPGM